MVEIDFSELGIDVFAGTIIGTVGAVLELSAASLATVALPTIFTASTVPLFAGIVGLGLFAGAIFTKVGSRAWNASTAPK